MKKIYIVIILLVLIAAGIFWLSSYSIKTGLRMPDSYQECVSAGGATGDGLQVIVCKFKNKTYVLNGDLNIK